MRRCAASPTTCFAWPRSASRRSTRLIERNAEHWRMDRMAAVDRNVLALRG